MRLLGVDRGAQEVDNCVVSCLVNIQRRRGDGILFALQSARRATTTTTTGLPSRASPSLAYHRDNHFDLFASAKIIYQDDLTCPWTAISNNISSFSASTAGDMCNFPSPSSSSASSFHYTAITDTFPS